MRLVILYLTLLVAARPAVVQAQTGGAWQVDRATSERLLKELGKGFSPHHSAHFTIISNAVGGSIDPLRQSAESVYVDVMGFVHRLQLRAEPSANKLIIVFFESWAQYQAAANAAGLTVHESLPGFFDAKTGICYVYNFGNAGLVKARRDGLAIQKAEYRAMQAKAGKEAQNSGELKAKLEEISHTAKDIEEQVQLINRTVIRHEIAHQILNKLGVERAGHSHRRWLIEGLAMQFETPPPSNPYRINDFLDVDWSHDAISLRTLIADPGRLSPRAERMSQAYALAWALVHFLIQTRPAEFQKYLENPPVIRPEGDVRQSELAAFESVFGRVDSEMERGVQDHVRKYGKQKP